MTVYPGIEGAVVPLTPLFSFYGTEWIVIRPSATGLGNPTFTNEGTITDFGLVPNTQDRARLSAPQVPIFGADWFGWGPSTSEVTLHAGDILWSVQDATAAFIIQGVDNAQFGPRFLGCSVIQVDSAWPSGGTTTTGTARITVNGDRRVSVTGDIRIILAAPVRTTVGGDRRVSSTGDIRVSV